MVVAIKTAKIDFRTLHPRQPDCTKQSKLSPKRRKEAAIQSDNKDAWTLYRNLLDKSKKFLLAAVKTTKKRAEGGEVLLSLRENGRGADRKTDRKAPKKALRGV